MKVFIPFFFIILLSCCAEKRPILHSGFDDLSLGVYEFKLFENGEFSLEISAGAKEGRYQLQNDTIHLDYYKEAKDWPKMMKMTQEEFTSIDSKQKYIISRFQ